MTSEPSNTLYCRSVVNVEFRDVGCLLCFFIIWPRYCHEELPNFASMHFRITETDSSVAV